MEFEEALRKAASFMREAKGKGYFLSSVFSSIKGHDKPIGEWILHFSGKGKAVDCYVKDDSVTVEESQSLGETMKLETESVKISATEAVKIAGERPAITILLSLHGSPPVWTINFISAAMNATTVDVDAKTGKITREETTSILKRN